MARAPLLVTSLLTFAETRAAFAKAQRMNALSASAVTWATARFIQDWSHVDVLGVDEALVVLAGELASRHGLRGYDAVHLASALRVAGAGQPVLFASFDLRLTNAAAAEGLSTDLKGA